MTLQIVFCFLFCFYASFLWIIFFYDGTKFIFVINSSRRLFRAIAMPETLHSLEVKNKCDKRVTRFVVPLSASIGRAGTCLYICVSCLFVIQLVGLDLTLTKITLVWYVSFSGSVDRLTLYINVGPVLFS